MALLASLLAAVLAACGQKGPLIAARPAPSAAAAAAAAASSPDTLPIPGISPADRPAPVPKP